MEYKRDATQHDMVDNIIGFGVSFGFFILIAIIFTIASLMHAA
ncbi:YqzM family protein [Ammoniphilus oxalaticus]|nr:YqzM family protein [Ammoniphilus oxalaticus]